MLGGKLALAPRAHLSTTCTRDHFLPEHAFRNAFLTSPHAPCIASLLCVPHSRQTRTSAAAAHILLGDILAEQGLAVGARHGLKARLARQVLFRLGPARARAHGPLAQQRPARPPLKLSAPTCIGSAPSDWHSEDRIVSSSLPCCD